MDLLPWELRSEIPDIYGQEYESDKMIYIRFHTKNNEYQWFLTEFSQEDENTCFGYAVTNYGCEMEYFTLAELQLSGLVIRDDRFTPQKWSLVKQEFDA